MFNYFDISQFYNYYNNFILDVYYTPYTTVFHFFVVGIIGYLYFQKQVKNNPQRKFFFPALTLRIFFAILSFSLIEFPFNIGGDAMSFFSDSCRYSVIAYHHPMDYLKQLMEPFPTHPYLLATLKTLDYPRNLFVIKLLSLLNLVTFSDYFADSFYLVFFVFMGTWKLSNLFVDFDKDRYRLAPLCFLLLPSICYFSSSTSKDSISIGALFFILYYVLKIFFFSYKLKWYEYLWLFILSYVLYKTKFFMLGAILPPALALLITKQIFSKNNSLSDSVLKYRDGIKIAFVFTLLYMVCMVIPVLFIQFNSYALNIQVLGIFNEYDTNVSISQGSLYIHFDELKPEILSYIKYFPKAIIGTLYRPFIWEIHSLRMIIPAMENLLILILTPVSVYLGLRTKTYHKFFCNKINLLFFMFLVSYVFVTAGLLGITSPIFGTLLRYRIMIFPFFWLLILIRNKTKSKIPNPKS